MDRPLIPLQPSRPAPLASFGAAPHRVLFAGGALQANLALAWWLADLLARHGGAFAPLPLALPPVWVHGFLMVNGFFPFFMFGFLMTAMPNWLGRDKPAARVYASCAGLMFGGLLLFYAGAFAHAAFAYIGIALLLAGWAIGIAALLRVVREAGEQDLRHARVFVAALAAGWLCAAAFGLGLAAGSPALAAGALHAGVWLFLLPVFATVSHRMIPFFSSRVLSDYRVVRPYWALWLLLAAAAGHLLLQLAGLRGWLWLADLPGLALAGYLTITWQFHRAFVVRLLAVLHLAFLWLAVAFGLSAWQSLALAAGGAAVLGLAPLHALTIGFFSSMVIGMASRVSLGHSGRPLVADTPTWLWFLAVVAAAVLRVLADLPGFGHDHGRLLILSAALWLAGFLFWTVKYLPIYLAPRADGQPG